MDIIIIILLFISGYYILKSKNKVDYVETGNRGFQIITEYKYKNVHIPERHTEHSAGYDIESAVTIEIEPNKIVTIPTGIKVFMEDDEVFNIYIRSSLALKKGLVLTNAVGIIDSDYYNNLDNEGHIQISLCNIGTEAYHLEKGERVAQGIFLKYLTTNDDIPKGERTGGIGSTNT